MMSLISSYYYKNRKYAMFIFAVFVSVIFLLLYRTLIISVRQAPKISQLPNFIERIYPEPGQTGEIENKLCIDINVEYIWEEGDGNNVMTQVRDSLELRLGDMDVLSTIPMFYSTNSLAFIQNDEQKGSYPSSVIVCKIVKLSTGLNKASIQLTSSSGKNFYYNWEFYVDNIKLSTYSDEMKLALLFTLDS